MNIAEPHPLAVAREAAGFSKASLARASGAGYGALCHAEAGIYDRLAPRCLPALALLGLDADEAQAAHERWRMAQRT